MQDEIVTAILEALRVELARATPRVAPAAPVNAQAHALYLRGRYWWHRWNPEALRKASEYFQEALAVDPMYANPYSGLADCHFLRGFYGEEPPLLVMPKAQAAARRALEMNPNLGEAWCSLAMIENSFGWNSAQCCEYFHRSFDCNPGYALARAKYGTSYLTPLNRLEEANTTIRQALDLDPLSANIHADLVLNLFYQRRNEEGLEECRKAQEMDPTILKLYWFKGSSLCESGRFDEALRSVTASMKLAPRHPSNIAFLGYVRAQTGDREGALTAMAQLDALRRERYVQPSAWAFPAMALGDFDLAFDYLERGVAERDPIIRFLYVQWRSPEMVGDPRYQRIAAALGLTGGD